MGPEHWKRAIRSTQVGALWMGAISGALLLVGIATNGDVSFLQFFTLGALMMSAVSTVILWTLRE